MRTVLGTQAERTYALLRIIAGLLFAAHGAQKLFGWLGGESVPLASLMGAAGAIEFFGGLCVALGLFAGPLAFLCSGEMAVAYFMAHQPKGALPIQNQGELAVLYAFVFLYIATRGSGLYSLDAAIDARRGWRRPGWTPHTA
jgi:putative oxidoreductase